MYINYVTPMTRANPVKKYKTKNATSTITE